MKVKYGWDSDYPKPGHWNFRTPLHSGYPKFFHLYVISNVGNICVTKAILTLQPFKVRYKNSSWADPCGACKCSLVEGEQLIMDKMWETVSPLVRWWLSLRGRFS